MRDHPGSCAWQSANRGTPYSSPTARPSGRLSSGGSPRRSSLQQLRHLHLERLRELLEGAQWWVVLPRLQARDVLAADAFRADLRRECRLAKSPLLTEFLES